MADQTFPLAGPPGAEVRKSPRGPATGQGVLLAGGAVLVAVVLTAGLVFGPTYLLYGLAGLGGLAVLWCLLFRPYWYFWFLFPAIMSWSYTTYLKQSDVSTSTWMDKFSPWTIHLSFMPLADTMVLVLFLRIVCDPRFSRRDRWHPLDKALLVYLLAFPLAAVIGMMHRNSTTQTWTVWALGVRVPVLLGACYVVSSRLLSAQRQEAPSRFLWAPFVGLTLAMFGAAYRGLILHQILDRGGTPILLVSEANMLPVLATVGVVLLCARNTRLPIKIIGFVAALASLAVLLTSTRREILALTVICFGVMFFFLPRSLWRRFVIAGLSLAVGGAILVVAFLQLSGKAGQLWTEFMTGSGTTEVSADYRLQEIDNIVANLDKYGGWFWGEGLGRRWERLLPQANLYGGEGYGEDMGHVWLYAVHVPFLHNLLDQGVIGLAMMLTGLGLIYKIGRSTARAPFRGGEVEVFNRALLAAVLAGLLVCLTRLFGFPNVGLFAGSLLGAVDVWIYHYSSARPGETAGRLLPPASGASA